ncbi:MAG: peroxidase [Pseudomonadota bacterium]
MSFIKTTAPADAEGDVLAMYQRQQNSWGYVPNYAKVFSGRPEVLARWARLLAELRRPMDDRRFELVTFAAAIALRNSACSLQHGKLLAEFIGEDVVRDLRRGRFAPSLTELDTALFQFAQKVAVDASRVTAGDVQRLKALGLDDDEVFDVAGAAAGRAFFTKLLDGLGVETDSAFLALDEPFRRAMTVGRPIAFEEVERL